MRRAGPHSNSQIKPLHKIEGGILVTLCNKCKEEIRPAIVDLLYCKECRPTDLPRYKAGDIVHLTYYLKTIDGVRNLERKRDYVVINLRYSHQLNVTVYDLIENKANMIYMHTIDTVWFDKKTRLSKDNILHLKKPSKILLKSIKCCDGWMDLATDLGLDKFAYDIFEHGEYGTIEIEVDHNLNIIGGKVIPFKKDYK
jgi:hypothetical protein